MPKHECQKQKLLILADLLRRETDDSHIITMNQILAGLAAEGISAERKSIYDDIRVLSESGMDIVTIPGRSGGYQLVSREFELPELKLLVDAVQSSRFLSERKSRELIGKLEGLASKWEAQSLNRQVYTVGRVKSMNESIYYSIDTIQTAIAQNKQISFKYFQWNAQKKTEFRRGGQLYIRSPFALIWDSENYYLLAYDHTANPPEMRHYRVDKMKNLAVRDEPRLGRAEFEKLDMAEYVRSRFGMFSGTPQKIELHFCADLAGVVIDRFGKDTMFLPDENGEGFRVHVEAVISPQFMGWLAGLGTGVRILAPQSAVQQYVEYCTELLKQYNPKL